MGEGGFPLGLTRIHAVIIVWWGEAFVGEGGLPLGLTDMRVALISF